MIHLDISIRLPKTYDTQKAADKIKVVSDIHVTKKRGGKSGSWKVE